MPIESNNTQFSPVAAGVSPQISDIQQKQPVTQIVNDEILGREAFLKLLVTQLSHQDPLDPLKNEEFIAQTAQFSALEQMQELNKTILNQNGLQRTISNAMAVQYVGKRVEAPGSRIALTEGAPARLSAKLPENANVQFEIYNSNGKQVSTLNLGMQNAQFLRVEWAGRDASGNRLPDGVYTFSVRATNEAGATVDAIPVTSGQVSGVHYENGEALLSLHGELISPRDIFSASLP